MTWDPVGKLITDFRADDAVGAIVGTNPTAARVVDRRVRGQEPAPGDVQGPEKWRAFVLVRTQALPPEMSVPVQRARHLVQCFARSFEEAEALYVACHAVVHHTGPRSHGSGHALYVSHDTSGGAPATDPDTGQPYYEFMVESVATTQVVA